MDKPTLKKLIKGVRSGKVSETDAFDQLKQLPFTDLGHTKVDHHRALRQGAAEVIYAEGKTSKEIMAITLELRKNAAEVLLSRVSETQARVIKKKFPKAIHNKKGRTLRVPGLAARTKPKKDAKRRPVVILSGGTSDAPVVEEARETLKWLGIEHEVVTDVGVAGIHRLFAHAEIIERASAIIVVAGMEGALASVVGGMVSGPVIGVPVSVGYGAGAGGLAALLGMLNSCASGVTVMNVDNGFGAACAAARIMRVYEDR